MKLLLIGAGNMGGAMLQGLHVNDITVVEAYPPRVLELQTLYPTITIVSEIPSLEGYLVILAIKPQSFSMLHTKGIAEGVISIMAGVSLEKLKSGIMAKHYIRSMPNMAALVRKSATSLCGDVALKDEAMDILSSIGRCFWLESEKELDIATGLAGSAPAWIALVAEALSDGAVNLGMKREITYQYIATLFEGVGEVLKSEHPALLKDKVMSPAGTTAAGYAKLEEGKVRDSFIKAMEASYERAKGFSK
ncbi:pyrroline-5-carboxylate reductase [Sulfurospirillum multivorans]|uniref:Pyrroline-5-carboxylate reductase n=2 Tax=Sulfurospirillum multivorans TaxID=66821 RepID=A0AA86E0F0_SULMK|nr:pyrroline-5-carboxylate reductase [Sulfurospirillum multivorans]AHJ13665.1 pyrroline-5-carboxylate reductase [Sulfurospirillum multivorans DSM 12446]QEH07155.1 pyrroline-5-carboxylate reductase [Sulfurospirillum multivorans]